LGCRLIGSVAARREIVVRLNEDAVFAMPFCDAYWSRLLNRRYDYEEEIHALLSCAREERYGFVDCGANFGYWSVLASSKPFGAQQVLAIEAGGSNVRRLNRNAALNGNRFRCLHAAIAGNSGYARVTGTSHEKLETVPVARSEPGAVEAVSLDGLAEMRVIDASLPLVIKLDVEGVEIEALRGARGVLAGDSLVVCEEHGSDRKHSVSRYLMEENWLSLMVFDPAVRRFVRLDDLNLLDRMKRHRWVGYNVFATAGSAWKDRLLSACGPPTNAAIGERATKEN
jgi:FkbM family methyltransferase